MELTQKRLKEVMHYDPNTGVFTWKITSKRAREGNVIGSQSSHGYLEVRYQYKLYRLHRLAVLYMLGFLPKEVDHEDGNRSNNKWKNLRVADRTMQGCNTKRNKRNRSGVMGIFWDRGAWMTYINLGKRKYLGRCENFFEACCRRKSAELEYGFHENHGRI